MEYGIKYYKAQLDKETYILIPLGIIEGYSVGKQFYSTKVFIIPEEPQDLETNRVLINSVVTDVDLVTMYDMEDISFIKDYYFQEEKEKVIIVTVKDGKLSQRKIDIQALKQGTSKEVYEFIKEQPSVILNEDALDNLLTLDTIKAIRTELIKLRKQVTSLDKMARTDSVTSVTLENGKITNIETDHRIVGIDQPRIITRSKEIIQPQILTEGNISVEGLEKYLRERIIGHDEEIRNLATILLMNQCSTREYGTQSILIPGPTGTGKTATLQAASEYLGIPFAFVNTINLVPQGIKGTSIEDVLYSLLQKTGGNKEQAEKSLITFDEFDKVGKTGTDFKEDIKQILLKFIEGSEFQIDKQNRDYLFDTRMSSKVFLGAFPEAFEQEKASVGFRTDTASKDPKKTFDVEKIYKNYDFSKELVTRIPHILPYYELSNDDKKRVILESKISTYLLKKKRYKEQFGIDLVDSDEYIDALIEHLSKNDRSMRDLNNIIAASLLEAENAILRSNGKASTLVLTGDTVTNPSSFKLN